ncbi:MAG TPA: rod shape-determining protein MreD [Clostridia bacterium]|nr:rod shape-determining protein MreD [Clostridia bacterium]
MHYFILGAALFLSLTLEATLFNHLTLAGVKPDLLLVLVIIYSLFRGSAAGAKLGFVYGLVEDLLLGNYVGLNAACKMLVGYAIGWGEKRFFKDNILVPVFAVFTGTLGFLLIYFMLFSLVAGGGAWAPFSHMVLPLCAYNTLLGILLYRPLYRSLTEGLLRPERR